MSLLGFLFWVLVLLALAKITNFFAKRPVFNPWSWLAGAYAFGYILGIAVGVIQQAPNLAYVAGRFLPLTLLAVGLGLWRAPKWRLAHQMSSTD